MPLVASPAARPVAVALTVAIAVAVTTVTFVLVALRTVGRCRWRRRCLDDRRQRMGQIRLQLRGRRKHPGGLVRVDLLMLACRGRSTDQEVKSGAGALVLVSAHRGVDLCEGRTDTTRRR